MHSRVSMFECAYILTHFPLTGASAQNLVKSTNTLCNHFFPVQCPAIFKALVLPPKFLLKCITPYLYVTSCHKNLDTQDNSLIRTLSVVLRRKCPYW